MMPSTTSTAATQRCVLCLAVTWLAGVAMVTCACDMRLERKGVAFMKEMDAIAVKVFSSYRRVAWTYATNITSHNKRRMLEARKKQDSVVTNKMREAMTFKVSDLCSNITKTHIAVIVGYLGSKEESNETLAVKEEISKLDIEMKEIYSSAQVCPENDPSGSSCMELEPDLKEAMREERNETRLSSLWQAWRDASGRKIRQLFARQVRLNKQLLRRKEGTTDRGKRWRDVYSTGDGSDFESDVKELLEKAMPLYKQLHTYVRRKLQNIYPSYHFPESRLIPAHMLGDLLAQNWDNLAKDLMPFPDQKPIDITQELIRQNYTVLDMFHSANRFFTSLNLTAMPDTFWNNSMFVRPPDGRKVVCHPSAWDFRDGNDFRIKMCASVNQEDFITIHHEMGHVQYFLQYRHQPFIHQNGANPGFHEAVGDTLALSVITTTHLKAIGLLAKDAVENYETDMNFLVAKALFELPFIPYSYLLDRWRWDVFSGKTSHRHYNEHWWRLRCQLQGLKPPVDRSEDDFDPGAKFHIAADVPYIRYFVRSILQFQFYEALCNATNHTGPLYKCDFYNNPVAGKKLSEMLRLGSSKPWPDALELLTGTRKMDIRPLMRYFRSLIGFLEKSNEGHEIGWDDSCEHPDKASLARTSTAPVTSLSLCLSSLGILIRFTLISERLK